MAKKSLYDDPKRNKRDLPYIVEIAVPENGLGNTLDVIAVFHMQLALEQKRGRGRHEEGRDFVRWCFDDPQTAGQFQGLFGGAVLGP